MNWTVIDDGAELETDSAEQIEQAEETMVERRHGAERKLVDASNDDRGERIARLEEQMEHLLGNGQPGVIAGLSESLKTFTDTMTRRMITEDARDALRQEQEEDRQKFANKWWKRIAMIAGIGASIATISNVEAPAIRHFLHTHGLPFVQESIADAPKPQSSIAPMTSELPFAARR